MRASATVADTSFGLGRLNRPLRTNPLFQGSAEARSRPGAKCLGGVPVQPGSQRNLWLPQRRVRSGDVVGGRRSGHQPSTLGAAAAAFGFANHRRAVRGHHLVHR